MDIKQFTDKCNMLLTNRGMYPAKTTGLKDFVKHFTAHAWLAHSLYGDGDAMLDILLDDAQLVGGEIFNTNFYLRFDQIYPTALKNNKAWQQFMTALIGFKGKGMGVGEMYLALVIAGWKFDRTNGKGDGMVAGGIRELKNNGASLKPLAEAIRVQDQLNRTLFEGHRAGPITKFDNHLQWIRTKDALSVYTNYFTQLYPGRDISELCTKLATVQSGREFYDTIGKIVLKWYQEIDHWNSLIIIDQKKMMIGNIADVTDLSQFPKVKFDWKSERGGDTQAITDGYVNISI